MIPCEAYLYQQLQRSPFISLDTFMEIALYHPAFGYYTNRIPVGKEEDFITAPEISPLFGSVLGNWVYAQYQRLGCPSRLNLIELGPGRGTLMADLLDHVLQWPDLSQVLDIHLIEISPLLQKFQKDHLKDSSAHFSIHWYNSLEEISPPQAPWVIIGNEFLDALPVRQFQKIEKGWVERGVVVNDTGALEFGHADLRENEVNTLPSSLPLSSIIEQRPQASKILKLLLEALNTFQGALVFIDYGYQQGYGDSLQAVANHQYVPVLSCPGDADLTAHVNFGELIQQAESYRGFETKLITQGSFLTQFGLIKEAIAQSKNASSLEKDDLATQLHRLTSPSEMGTLFKVLWIER